MNESEVIAFCEERIEARLNGYAILEVMERVRDCYIEDSNGFQWINDPGHGYLIVPKASPHYGIAEKIASQSYSYRTASGSILLEEDCEAPKFLKAIEAKTA